MRYTFIPVKKQEVISAVEGVEKREHLCTIGGNMNLCCSYGKQYGGCSKNLK